MIINISKSPIINAFYGYGNKKINVIKLIEKYMKNNSKISITSDIFNKDPCPGIKKNLYITLKNNKKYEIEDNSYIQINDYEIKIFDDKTLINKNIQKNKVVKKNITTKKLISKNIKYDYILSTNIRDEHNILEFIIYHLMIGFDKIFIIDHLSKEKIINKIEILPDEYKNRIDIIRFEKEGSHKLYFLNDIVLPYMKKNCNKYFIHLDGDEYLNLNNKFDFVHNLLEDFNFPDILIVNWVLFGSNNKENNDNKYKCLIPTYTKSDGGICNHFKIFINVKLLTENIIFVNPHQIFNITKKKLTYTNISNKKFNFTVIEKCYDFFIKSFPSIKIEECKAYINHYIIQSKEDYFNRKVDRNRDDINVVREYNESIFNKHNDINNDNLKNYYIDIKNILDINDFGFIILRCIVDKPSSKMWVDCYNSIRKFYKNKIMIIDDHSNTDFLSNKKLENCFTIESEYKGRGEFLPYYYYLKYKFCNRVIVLHDSMIIKKKIEFKNINNFKNFTRLFSFNNNCYNIDIQYFKMFCNIIKNGNTVYKYHLKNKNKLIGCFGVCYVINYDFLKMIEDKYSISNLVNIIDTRDKRKTLERFFSCLFEMESNSSRLPHLINCIFIILKKQKLNEEVLIEKKFYGR